MGGDKPVGRFFILKGHKTRNTAVILPRVGDARFTRRNGGFRNTTGLVAPFNVNGLLRFDFLSGDVVGHSDALHLIGIVPFMVQRAAGTTRKKFLPILQHYYGFVSGLYTTATDLTLSIGKDEATISEIAPSRRDCQKQESNEQILEFHWPVPFAMALTSPYHFQIA